MTDPVRDPAPHLPPVTRPGVQPGSVAAAIGWVMTGAGALAGVAMVFNREEAPCTGDVFFPKGDGAPICYAHPQALAGLAVLAICAALACLIFLASRALIAVTEARLDAQPQPSTRPRTGPAAPAPTTDGDPAASSRTPD